MVTTTRNDYLTLCEVNVYGKAGPPYANAQHAHACASAQGASTCSIANSEWHGLVTQPDDGWALCEAAAVATRNGTCSDHCKKFGLQCARAQDNAGSGCSLDGRHTRKTTAHNGCDQRWGNQVYVLKSRPEQLLYVVLQ